MKIFRTRLVSSLILLTVVFTGFSCAHRNAEMKNKAVVSEEEKKREAEYLKELQDAKRIVVARVNGAAITLNDLINKMNQLASAYMPESHQRTPEIDQAVKQEALDILIFRELAVQEARRQGMTVPPETLDNFIQTMRKNIGSEDAFQEYLRKTDNTEESLRKTAERNLLFDMIASKEIGLQAEGGDAQSVEMRKKEWESELKKDASIEILLEEASKKIKEDAEKPAN